MGAYCNGTETNFQVIVSGLKGHNQPYQKFFVCQEELYLHGCLRLVLIYIIGQKYHTGVS